MYTNSLVNALTMEWWNLLILVIAGAIAGFINSMAGAGSLITLPALMLTGLPADVANGTNRVGILVQSFTSYMGYRKAGVGGFGRSYLLMIPMCIGAVIGALVVGNISSDTLNRIVIGVMLLTAVLVFIQPAKWAKPLGDVPTKLVKNPWAWLAIFITGFYAGFIQVGSNFILLIMLVLWGNFDILHANAFKQIVQLAFTILVLPIFCINGKVAVIQGLILSAGTLIGSWTGSLLAVKKGAKFVRWLILAAVVLYAIRQIVARI